MTNDALNKLTLSDDGQLCLDGKLIAHLSVGESYRRQPADSPDYTVHTIEYEPVTVETELCQSVRYGFLRESWTRRLHEDKVKGLEAGDRWADVVPW